MFLKEPSQCQSTIDDSVRHAPNMFEKKHPKSKTPYPQWGLSVGGSSGKEELYVPKSPGTNASKTCFGNMTKKKIPIG